jgi:hypothetical protein
MGAWAAAWATAWATARAAAWGDGMGNGMEAEEALSYASPDPTVFATWFIYVHLHLYIYINMWILAWIQIAEGSPDRAANEEPKGSRRGGAEGSPKGAFGVSPRRRRGVAKGSLRCHRGVAEGCRRRVAPWGPPSGFVEGSPSGAAEWKQGKPRGLRWISLLGTKSQGTHDKNNNWA